MVRSASSRVSNHEASGEATPMASSFETQRFALLLRTRSQTLMVRSASSRVSNHEASGEATPMASSFETPLRGSSG